MNKKTPIKGSIRIYCIVALTIMLLLSNFFMIEISQTENTNKTNEEEMGEYFENSKIYENEEIKEIIKQNLTKTKGSFTKNQGQLKNDEIYFTYSASDMSFGFCESSVLIKLTKTLEDNTTRSSIIKLTFENSNQVIPIGNEELIYKSNFFIGKEKSNWKSNVPNYEKIFYKNLYEGIDLVYYFNEKGLKYDWIIKPYATPSQIVEKFEGHDSIKIDSDGKLIINTEVEELKEEKPYSYQKVCGNIVKVDVNFKFVKDNSITYEIVNYDTSIELIIDPLIYSTFIGGKFDDERSSIVIDSKNNSYITGPTSSSDFPTSFGCFDNSQNGRNDVFVCKLNSEGSDLVYSTFIGGGSYDYSENIAIDSNNNVYVTGQTISSDFPTSSGCYQKSKSGGYDVFVFMLNSNGSSLIYSTFVGGGINDYGYSITLDFFNNTYITGCTHSSDFPTTWGSFDRSFNNGDTDLFVFKLNSNGSDLIYSTYVGGDNKDTGYEITVDLENYVYVTGYTYSTDFPTTSNCFNNSNSGQSDVFVFKLNQMGSDLLYSTYVGGSDKDYGDSIALDSDKNTYITGRTKSSDFPTTPGCYDDSNNKGDPWGDVFVSKLNENGSVLIYSTFVGGNSSEIPLNIILDSHNNSYVTGSTGSSDFPTTYGCYDELYNEGSDVFIFILNTKGTDLIYSTFVGGSNYESGYNIARDSMNNVYITGKTSSGDFPTTSSCYDNSRNGGMEIFVFKLNLTQLTTYAAIETISPNPTNESEQVHFSGKGTDENGTIVNYKWISRVDGFLSNKKSFTLSNLSNGTYKIYFKVQNNSGVWSDEVFSTITRNGIPRAKVDDITPNPANEGDFVWFYGDYIDFENNIIDYYWESDIDGILSNQKDFSVSTLTNGTHTITFRVKDSFNVWSENVSINFTINGVPRAKIDEIIPDISLESEEVWFYGNGTDDGTINGYKWSSDIDDFLSIEKSFKLSNLSNGTHIIYFKVKDNHDVWSDEVSSTLIINGNPKANINEITPNPVNEGEFVWFFGNGTDDGNIEEYYWKSNIDKFLSDKKSFNLSNLSNGTHTISFKVKDNYDVWSNEVNTTLTIICYPRAEIYVYNTMQEQNAEIYIDGMSKGIYPLIEGVNLIGLFTIVGGPLFNFEVRLENGAYDDAGSFISHGNIDKIHLYPFYTIYLDAFDGDFDGYGGDNDIEIIVVDINNKYIKDAKIYFEREYFGETNEVGFFYIYNIPPGKYYLNAEYTDAWDNLFEDDFEVLVGFNSSISGYILDNESNPLGYSHITIIDTNTGYEDTETTYGWEDSQYFIDIYSGEFELYVKKYGYIPNKTVIKVSQKDQIDLNFYLIPVPKKNATIKGYLLNEKGEHIEGTVISNFQKYDEMNYTITNETDIGYYEINVFSGFNFISGVTFDSYTNSSIIFVEDFDIIWLNITVYEKEIKNSKIKGTISNETGDPIEGAKVFVTNKKIGIMLDDYGEFENITDEFGYYEINVPKGLYYIGVENHLDDDLLHGKLDEIYIDGEVTKDIKIVAITFDSEFNLTFSNWNNANINYEMLTSMDCTPEFARLYIDFLFGNKDGYVDENEANIYKQFIYSVISDQDNKKNSTKDDIYVDEIYYNLEKNSYKDFEIVNAVGFVINSEPILMKILTNLTSIENISIFPNHTIKLNITYEKSMDEPKKYILSFPDGFLMYDFISTENVTINVIDIHSIIIEFVGEYDDENKWEFAIIKTTTLPIVEIGEDLIVNESEDIQFDGSIIIVDSGEYTIEWDFGDGSKEIGTLSPKHVYEDNGIYKVILKVKDIEGDIGTDTIIITVNNIVPIVNAGEDKIINEGEEIQFDGSIIIIDGGDYTIEWNFRDGSKETENLTPKHVYEDNGIYTVMLTIIDKDGDVGIDTSKITVNNVVPEVNAGINQKVTVGEFVNFVGSFSDVGILDTHTIEWIFGDGTSKRDILNTTHIYTTEGKYSVTLKVIDDDGGIGEDIIDITVILDMVPPKISNVEINNLTKKSVTIIWHTNEKSTSQIEYGKTNEFGKVTDKNENHDIIHIVTITNLESNKTYYFRVKSIDKIGNENFSQIFTFKTIEKTKESPLTTDVDIDVKLEISNTELKEGDEIIITAKITNNGKNSVEINVIFYCNDKIIGKKEISVETGKTINSEITWKAEKGNHTIKVVVIYNGKEIKNATVSKKIDVKEKTESEDSGVNMIFLFPLIILPVVFLVINLIRRNRGGMKQVEQNNQDFIPQKPQTYTFPPPQTPSSQQQIESQPQQQFQIIQQTPEMSKESNLELPSFKPIVQEDETTEPEKSEQIPPIIEEMKIIKKNASIKTEDIQNSNEIVDEPFSKVEERTESIENKEKSIEIEKIVEESNEEEKPEEEEDAVSESDENDFWKKWEKKMKSNETNEKDT